MSTIDQVVAASENLSLAIEAYHAACTPLKLRGFSFAMEEAQEDGKEQAKATAWERFKAFIKRIKDWFMGLFKKRQSELDKIEQQEAQIKKFISDWKKNDPLKDTMDKFRADMEKSRNEIQERWGESLNKMRDNMKARDAERAAEAKRRQEAQTEADAKTAADNKQREEEFAKQQGELRAKMQEAHKVFAAKRSEILEAAKASVDELLRKKFSSEIPSVMKIVMSVEGSGDDVALGREILTYLDEAKVRIVRIDRILLNLSKGQDSGVKDYEDGTKINIEKLKDIFSGNERSEAWIKGIPQHSHEELIRGYNRYCGYVVNICSTLGANLLRRIDDTIKNTVETTEELSQKEGIDVAGIAAVQKIYAEEIAPISSDISKIIVVYGDSLKQATAIGHLNYGILDAVKKAAQQVLGEETYHSLNWSETVGVLANEVIGKK